MLFSLKRWKAGHLLLSWVAYWVALVAIKLGPAIAAAWRVSRLPTGGTISASFENTLVKLSMLENGTTVWSGSAQLPIIALWVAGPPLLIWAAWLMRRPRGEFDTARDLSSGSMPRGLPAGMPTMGSLRTGEVDKRVGERVARPATRGEGRR